MTPQQQVSAVNQFNNAERQIMTNLSPQATTILQRQAADHRPLTSQQQP